MSAMSDQPVTLAVLTTALVQFHREIVLPDLQKVVEASEGRLRNEMHGLHDSLLQKLAKLETEYEFLKVGLARVEGRLERIDQRLDGMDGRLVALETLYRELLAAVNRLEERLSRVERQVDAIAAEEKDPLRAEVADLRRRVDSLQAQVRTLEGRLDR